MSENKPLRKRVQDVVNRYIEQEQRAHAAEGSVAPEGSTFETSSAEADHTAGEQQLVVEKLAALEEQLRTAMQERDEFREKYVRALAEMDNLRKRTEREKEQIVLYATERLFSRLVELLDDLHAAVQAGKQSRDYEAMHSGLEMIATKAHRLYEEHGVRPLEAKEGEPFNVELHEALIHVPHPELPEGTIVQQVQRGYLFRDRVLRHARVVTSAGAAGADGSGDVQSPPPSEKS
ncbi:MAG: protein GrpE [Candidatus Kapaibacterium sp.]|nr:MAG: protein GrpE [Candidatus Kapabacteria bacterium]